MTAWRSAKYIPLAATAVVLAGAYLAGCLLYPNFASLHVVVSLLGDNAFLGVAAVGMTFVILSGGIDLSVGAMVAFTSILIAALIEQTGLHPLAAIAIALGCGAVFGAGMGALIHFFRLPPFLVTLAGMFLARGLAFVIRPQSLGIRHAFYLDTINEHLAIPLSPALSIPFTAVCFAAVWLIGLYVAHWTRFGRCVYAVGDDEQAAVLMGLPVGRTKIFVYALSGSLAALAGVVYTFYTQAGDPASCVGFELDVIAAVVIGGTLLRGGVGFLAGTALGVLTLGLIQTLITFQGDLSSWWTRVIVGGLLLAFLALQNTLRAFERSP